MEIENTHLSLSLSLSNSKLKLYIPFQSCRDRKKDSNSKTMKAFLGLSVLILLLAEEALCSSREQRLSKLLEKVEARVASSPTGRLLAPPPREAVDNHTRVKENYSHIFIILCLLTLFVILIFLSMFWFECVIGWEGILSNWVWSRPKWDTRQ